MRNSKTTGLAAKRLSSKDEREMWKTGWKKVSKKCLITRKTGVCDKQTYVHDAVRHACSCLKVRENDEIEKNPTKFEGIEYVMFVQLTTWRS
jgi:hypothetical protein